MNPDAIITRKESWLTASIGDELVMMNADSNVYLSLSGTGSRIWQLLEEPRTLNSLSEMLADEYDAAPQTIREEVRNFLEKLQAQHAIEIQSSALA